MDPIFEINSTYCMPLYTEAYRHVIKKWLTFLYAGISFIFLCLALYQFSKFFLMHFGINLVLGFEFLIGAVLMMVILLRIPHRLAKRQFNMNHSLYHGQDVQTRTQYYADSIHSLTRQSGAELNLTYAQISRCIETKHLFLIVIDKQSFLMMQKGCFSIGTEVDFRQFLRQHCPNAKMKFYR